MKYTVRSDVILNTICGELFLIAAGDARGFVPYIEGITKPGAYFWNHLEQGEEIDEIIETAAKEYNTSEENAEKAFWKFAKTLEVKGYISFSD